MKKIIIISPVYNEASTLKTQVPIVLNWCKLNLKDYDWTYGIIDNASTDLTSPSYIGTFQKVKYFRLIKKGRGRALKWVWKNIKFDFCIYMDIDLATDLDSINTILKKLESGTDLVVGSRWMPESVVRNRKPQRTLLSFSYKSLVRFLAQSSISDFQCGFKGVSKKFILKILPTLKDNGWFLDTELVLIAEKQKFKVIDIPVIWRDNLNSKVKIFEDSWYMFKNLLIFLNASIDSYKFERFRVIKMLSMVIFGGITIIFSFLYSRLH